MFKKLTLKNETSTNNKEMDMNKKLETKSKQNNNFNELYYDDDDDDDYDDEDDDDEEEDEDDDLDEERIKGEKNTPTKKISGRNSSSFIKAKFSMIAAKLTNKNLQHSGTLKQRVVLSKPEKKNSGAVGDKNEQVSETSSVTEPTPSSAEYITRKFGQKFIILHYSPFKAVWDWIVLLLVLYTAIVTPYTAAFLLNEDEKRAKLNQNAATRLLNSERTGAHPLVILDLIVDVMFLVDILLSFRTTCVSKEGEIISDPMSIAKNYLKGWFFIDAIAAMPYDLLIFGSGNIDTLKITGLLKIIRLLRLARIFKKLEQYSEYGSAVLLSLLAVFVIAGHWLACVFYAIAYIERPTLPDPKYTWLDHLAEKYNIPYDQDDLNSGPDLNSKYLTALFFTLTSLTSVGFGNVAPTTNGEKCFSIIAMLLGSLLSAAIFGNVTTIMMKMYQGTEELKEMRTCVTDFIKFHSMPKCLSKRMHESFEHTWSYTNGIDMNTVLKSFPESLQADICLHLNRQLLNRCPAFQDANAGCLRMLALQFKSTHVPPGDTLIHKGDNLSAIYFIARGTLEIVKDDDVMAILDKNDIFGENLSKYEEEDIMGRASCDVRALVYCDLHKIEKSDLLDILDMYPDFAESFKKNFQVTFDLRECELNEKSNMSKKRHQVARRKESSFNTQNKNLTSLVRASNIMISTVVDPISFYCLNHPKRRTSLKPNSSEKDTEQHFLDSSLRLTRNKSTKLSPAAFHSKFNFSIRSRPSLLRKCSNKTIYDLQEIEQELENLIARTTKIEDTLRTQMSNLTHFVLNNVINTRRTEDTLTENVHINCL